MVLDKPLITWEKLTNLRDRNRLWERPEREELGEKNAFPIGYRVSSKCKLGANVI